MSINVFHRRRNALINSGTAIPIANLVHYYRLNADANDSVATLHGTATDITYTSGKTGNASTYNGSSSKIQIPNGIWATNPDEISISGFFKATNNTSAYRFVSINDGSLRPFTYLRYNTGSADNITALARTGDVLSSASFDTTTWLYLTITAVKGGAVKLYVNGVEVDSGTNTNFSNTTPTNNFLGSSRTGISVFFNGQMFGVGFWDKALTSDEVLAAFNKQNAGNHLI